MTAAPQPTPDDHAAWSAHLAKLIDGDKQDIRRRTRRPKRHHTPTPAERQRRIDARLREHRVTKAGSQPCPDCGGGLPGEVDDTDVCRCGSSPEQWEGRVWALAARVGSVRNPRRDGVTESLERSGWR